MSAGCRETSGKSAEKPREAGPQVILQGRGNAKGRIGWSRVGGVACRALLKPGGNLCGGLTSNTNSAADSLPWLILRQTIRNQVLCTAQDRSDLSFRAPLPGRVRRVGNISD